MTWLDNARYFSLATFRRNGAEVRTPVWFAREGDFYYVFSAPDAGKVKRLRLSSRSRIAPCDVRGALAGDWLEARTQLVGDANEIARAHRALQCKYGWQMSLLDLGARISGRYARRQYLKVAPLAEL